MVNLFRRIYNKLQRLRNMIGYCRSVGVQVGRACVIQPSVNIGTEPNITIAGVPAKKIAEGGSMEAGWRPCSES